MDRQDPVDPVDPEMSSETSIFDNPSITFGHFAWRNRTPSTNSSASRGHPLVGMRGPQPVMIGLAVGEIL